MSDEPDKPDLKRWWPPWIVFAMLVLYPLSMGPAALLFVKTDYGRWYLFREC